MKFLTWAEESSCLCNKEPAYGFLENTKLLLIMYLTHRQGLLYVHCIPGDKMNLSTLSAGLGGHHSQGAQERMTATACHYASHNT